MSEKEELSNFKAVILAGGKGTRLYPITKEMPKPLLVIKRKPIVNYLVELFHSFGIQDIAVLVNETFLEDFEWWKKRYYPERSITFFTEQEPLGTFGGLWNVRDWAGSNSLFITNGDELKEIDLGQMAEFHQGRGTIGTIALVEVENPQDYGVVTTNEDLVEDFLEKPQNPPTNYINSGLYLFSPEIFTLYPGPQFLMMEKDIFPDLAKKRKIGGFKFQGKWLDMGTWERYNHAIEEWEGF